MYEFSSSLESTKPSFFACSPVQNSPLKTVFGSIKVEEHILFRMFQTILIFDFDLIFGSGFTFWGPMSY